MVLFVQLSFLSSGHFSSHGIMRSWLFPEILWEIWRCLQYTQCGPDPTINWNMTTNSYNFLRRPIFHDWGIVIDFPSKTMQKESNLRFPCFQTTKVGQIKISFENEDSFHSAQLYSATMCAAMKLELPQWTWGDRLYCINLRSITDDKRSDQILTLTWI